MPGSPAILDFAAGFAVALMLKDLSLAADAVAETGAGTVLGAAARDAYARLAAAGLGHKDFSVTGQVLRAGNLP